MKFRSTIIVGLLLAGLGAYAYFVEYKGEDKKKEQEENKKTLLEIKKDDVAALELETGGQTIRVVPLSDEKWQLTAPMQARADEGTVSRILSNFEKLQYQDIADEQPKDLGPYDLKNPKTVIRIFLKKGNSAQTLMIGSKNPVNDVYYARVNNDPRVYTVAYTAGDAGSTTLLDLRDKKLTDFSSEKVEIVDLNTSILNLEFRREGGSWKMKKPVESPASDSDVTSLLSSLEVLRASEFIDQPAPDLSVYGLEKPDTVVELTLEKGLHQRIEFGSKEGEQRYCRVEGSSSIAKVSDSLSNLFEKKLEDWREKKLVVFNRFDVTDLRIKTKTADYSFKKGKDDKWMQERPAKAEMESEKLQDLMEKLETGEISKYGDSPAVEGVPAMEVFLTQTDWQDKTTRKHLAFGEIKENQQAVKNDDYSTIVFVHGALQKQIETALTELKPKGPAGK